MKTSKNYKIHENKRAKLPPFESNVKLNRLNSPNFKLFGSTTAITLSISLAGCNDSGTTTTPCANGTTGSDFICVDSEISNSSGSLPIDSIEMPNQQIPVSGTTNSDTFIVTSGFLTSKTIINGGEGEDTLSLNLQNSVRSGPKISNIETFTLKSLGDYSLDLSNVSDLQYILSEGSLGKVTVNGLQNASTIFGFSGSGANNIILTGNDLGGSTDVLELKLIGAENVSFQAPIGYERLDIELQGPSSISSILASGISTTEVIGQGDLTIGSSVNDLSSFSSKNLDGKISGASLDYDGFSKSGVIGSILGTEVELGDASDNFYFVDKADANALNTVHLGPGDDKITYVISTHSQNSINGDQGDDQFKIIGEKLALNDIFLGGDGLDTVIIEQDQDNLINLSGIEKVVLKNIAAGQNTLVTSGSALSVIMEAGERGIMSNFSISGLPSDSDISIENSLGQTVGLGTFFANYETLEATDEITVDTVKNSGDFFTENIENLEINFLETVQMSASDFKFDHASNIIIDTKKDFVSRNFIGDDSTSVDRLETLSITGDKSVSIGNTVNTSQLSTINIDAFNDLIAGSLGSGSLSSIFLTSVQGKISASHIDVSNSGENSSISLVAKDEINADSGSAMVVSSSSGSIDANVSAGYNDSDSSSILLDLTITSPQEGIVNLTSTSTGGIRSTITNAGTQLSGEKSEIVLGNTFDTKENNITVGGVVNAVQIAGGTGIDLINFDSSNNIKSLSIDLSSGEDKIDFSNIHSAKGSLVDNGIALNLSDNSYNVVSGVAVPAGLAISGTSDSDVILKSGLAEYKPGSAIGNTLSTEHISGRINNVEWVVSTEQEDYLIASPLGNKFDGAGSNDELLGNINSDEFIGGTGDDKIYGKGGNDILLGEC